LDKEVGNKKQCCKKLNLFIKNLANL